MIAIKRISPALIILSGVLWGTMGIFVRRLNEMGIHSMEIVAFRAFGTSVAMLIFLSFYNRKLLKIKWKDMWCFCGTGLFSILFFNFCYFKTITLTSLSVAAVLLYTAPMIVMLLSVILFGEKFTVAKAISMLFAFGGCVLVSGITGSRPQVGLLGFCTGLGAGLGYALYSIFSRFALDRGYHPLSIMIYTFITAGIFVIPLADFHTLKEAAVHEDGFLLLAILFTLITTILPYICYTIGLSCVEAGSASIMASVEPVVASLIGIFLFHEKITAAGVSGIALVVASIIILNVSGKKKAYDTKAELY